MQPHELRVGNLVGYNELIGAILQINWDAIELLTQEYVSGVYAPGMIYETVRPIPLTKEWCLKLGFVEQENHVGLIARSPGYPSQRFDIDYWEQESEIFMKSGRWKRYNMNCFKMRHIKHVHEIQNLYYVLTGEELSLIY